MSIGYVHAGMKFGEVFDVINLLVDFANKMETALGSVLSGGVLDYNRLANKPMINKVELVGDMDPASFELSADVDARKAVRELGARMDGFFVEKVGYVQRITMLETHRTEDIMRVTTLEGEKSSRDQDLIAYKATMNALAASVSERMGNVESRETSRNEEMSRKVTEMKADVATVQQGLVQKADKSSTPDAATWVSLRAAMEADLARAEEAAAGVTSNEAFKEVVQRLKNTINRLNIAVNTAQAAYNGMGACGDTIGRTCLDPISNTFEFEE